MATRKRELRPDSEGRYRPAVGWCQEIRGGVRTGKRRQPRFNLGTDLKEAERRLARIRDLYEDNCRMRKNDLWAPLAPLLR